MQVTILGPNLPTQGETFHVHKSRCADITRSPIYQRAQRFTFDVPDLKTVVLDVYSDIMADNDEPDDAWQDYVSDFKVFPCADALDSDTKETT